jgi:hypothetical protein
MSTVDGQSAPGGWPSSEPADLKLEAVVIRVADADRSKALYAGGAESDWPDRYAEYMVREQSGQEFPV